MWFTPLLQGAELSQSSEPIAGQLKSLVDGTGWVAAPSGNSLVDVVSEATYSDADYIISSEITTLREIVYEIEPLSAGQVDLSLRAYTTKANGTLTVSLLNNTTPVYTFSPITTSQTIFEYVISGTSPATANRIKITIVEA